MESVSEDNIHELFISEEYEGRTVWNDAEVKLLLTTYGECIKCVGPNKKFKKKENIWPYIKEKLETQDHFFTIKQIKNKWTSLERSFKKNNDHNNKTGRNRKTGPYHRELQEILGKRSSINSPFLLETDSSIEIQDLENESSASIGDGDYAENSSVTQNGNNDIPGPTSSFPVNCSVNRSSGLVTVADLKGASQKRKKNKITMAEEIQALKKVKTNYYDQKLNIEEKKLQIYEEAVKERNKLLEMQNNMLRRLLEK